MKKQVFTLLTLLLVGFSSAWAAADYTVALSSFTLTDGTYIYESSSDICKSSGKTTWIEVPSVDANGTITIKGSTADTGRKLILYKANGTIADDSRVFESSTSYPEVISYTSGDVLTSGGKYYLVFVSSGDFKARGIKYTATTKPTTTTTVNAAKAGLIAYLDNSGSINAEKTIKSFSSSYFTLAGSNIQSGSGTFTIDTKSFTPFKVGNSSETEYEIVPADGATITAATLYVTSNNSDKACQINGTTTAKKGETPTAIVLSESGGKWGFTFEYPGDTHNQALIVLKVTYSLPASVDVTISSAGYATMYYSEKLEIPTGVTAYSATMKDASTVKLTEVDDVIPANTAVILQGAPGRYNFIVTDAAAPTVTSNILTGATTATAVSANTVYTLGQNGEGVVGLRLYSGTSIRAYSAYATSIAGARDFYTFDTDNETTGIEKVDSSKIKIEGYFNLAGQRVANPTKGLYIVNGRKVVIK